MYRPYCRYLQTTPCIQDYRGDPGLLLGASGEYEKGIGGLKFLANPKTENMIGNISKSQLRFIVKKSLGAS